MMAKMFYTLEETKAALQKNEEEIKQLAREGRLREFRDGPRLMFKADQVEAIKNDLGLGGGGGGADIGISDTGAPIGLVDTRSSSATGISLSDTDTGARTGMSGSAVALSGSGGSLGGSSPGGVNSGIALASSATGTGTGMGSASGSNMGLKDDTALAADLGLSGSMGGVPSPGRPGSSGLTGTAAGRPGISIFGEEGESADPMAQTNIASNVHDQVNMEVGSGSGLLDLTRESDDTSLGAELLDEIAPGSGSKAGSRGGSGSVSALGGSASGTAMGGGSMAGSRGGATAIAEPVAPMRGAVGSPILIEQADPLAPAFAGACFGASIFVIFGGLVLSGAILGSKVPLVAQINEKNIGLLTLAGIGFGVSLLFFVVGFLAGKR